MSSKPMKITLITICSGLKNIVPSYITEQDKVVYKKLIIINSAHCNNWVSLNDKLILFKSIALAAATSFL